MAAEANALTLAEIQAMAKGWNTSIDYKYPRRDLPYVRTRITGSLTEALLLARENRVDLGEVIREIDRRLRK